MSLILKYKEMSENQDVSKLYRNTGRGKYGKIFKFINTNFRSISSIMSNFNTFKTVDGVNRSDWQRSPSHGQEQAKQHTVNMLQMKFFSKNASIYYKTAKGKTFEEISNDFTEEERWLLTYILILDAYFDDTSNYMLERSKNIMKIFSKYTSGVEETIRIIQEFIKESPGMRKEEIFTLDYMYFDSFFREFNNYDILKLYNESPSEERQKLQTYIINNINCKSKDYKCILSHKFKSGGVYTKETVEDNAKIIYLSNKLNVYKETERFMAFNDFFDYAIKIFNDIVEINIKKVKDFIEKHNEVFRAVYINVLGYQNYYFSEKDIHYSILETQEVKYDTTKSSDIEKMNRASHVVKQNAKMNAGYKCELEKNNNCNYFISEVSQENYVEIHHLIPRAFSNEFEETIEVEENYISLCPSCHRLIHHAKIDIRKTAVNKLYDSRKKRLKEKKLSVSKNRLYNFYKIYTDIH